MPDPHGYAALASSRSEPRSRGGARALDRCQRMAAEHAESIRPSPLVPGA
jgi:hypothetical protein